LVKIPCLLYTEPCPEDDPNKGSERERLYPYGVIIHSAHYIYILALVHAICSGELDLLRHLRYPDDLAYYALEDALGIELLSNSFESRKMLGRVSP
jgi:hypothetical protein